MEIRNQMKQAKQNGQDSPPTRMGENIDFDHGEMQDFNKASNKQTRFFTNYNAAFVISEILLVLDLKGN
jgi:hypothetical protein